MTRFERQAIAMMIVSGVIFVAITWRLFASM